MGGKRYGEKEKDGKEAACSNAFRTAAWCEYQLCGCTGGNGAGI